MILSAGQFAAWQFVGLSTAQGWSGFVKHTVRAASISAAAAAGVAAGVA
jgi:hypothetical protein